MNSSDRSCELVNEILDVYEKSISETANSLSEESKKEIMADTEKMILDIENLIIIKDDNEKVIGFMGVENEAVEMICLHPNYKNKGIGKELMNVAINEHNVNKAYVKKINVSGIDFCKHMGFIPQEVTNGNIFNDAIEMRLEKI